MKLPLIAIGTFLLATACSAGPTSSDQSGTSHPDRPPKLGKAEGWDYKNDPQKLAAFLDKDLEYKVDALPREGKAKLSPWPDTYWPTYEDGTNHRWRGKDELSPLEKYDVAFNGWTATEDFMKLRPFNPNNCNGDFDKDYYEKLGPAAKYQSEHKGNLRSRDGVDSDGDGVVDECDNESNDGVESWWGMCHAWVPAAMNEPEPQYPVEHNGVTFYPSDIKALLITIYDRSKSIIIGGRCNAKEVERDEQGRIKDPSCRDTNAGTFHVLLTNMLGRYNMPIAEDRTYDYEVWNQPVHDFKIDLMQEIDLARANELLGVQGAEYIYNPDAKRFFQVQITVHYVTESSPSEKPLVESIGSYLRTDKYHYVLETDAEGKVIGGEWIKPGSTHSQWGFSQQPDFLWASLGPAGETTSNPYVRYSLVKELLAKSLIDPSQPPPAPTSCTAKCDSSEAVSVDGRTCYCDSVCFSYGDCCEDRVATCGGPNGGSCQSHCGKTEAAPGSTPPNLCYCDSGCAARGDCCADYGDACGS